MSAESIAVVGSVNLDLSIRAERAPQVGETVLGTDYSEHLGGKGANQAVGAARVAPTCLIGTIGTDWAAEGLRQELAASAVDATHLASSAATTGRAIIIVSADGDNQIIVSQGANLDVTPGQVVAALDDIHPSIVVAQLETPVPSVRAACDWAVANGRRWVLNLSPFAELPGEMISNADPLIVNEHEARQVLGRSADGSDIASVAVELSDRCKSIIVTAGPDGAFVVESGTLSHVPGEQVDVVDTTGAGDEFAGRVAAELLRNSSLTAAARRAAHAAAAIVSTPRDRRGSL